MPRISEKVQITRQLQDTWLAYEISNTLLDNDDIELLQKVLFPTPVHNQRPWPTPSSVYNKNLKIILEGCGLGMENSISETGMFGIWATKEDEEELGESIGLLGIMI